MSTVSTWVPSPSSHSHFTVSPPSLVCSVTDVERERQRVCSSSARRAFGSSVSSDGLASCS